VLELNVTSLLEYFSFLAPDVGNHAYDLFVEDIEVITDNSDLCDVILVDEESGSVLPLNVTTNLESDLNGGLFGYDLDQVNVVPNDNGTFLDLVFTNACTDSPLYEGYSTELAGSTQNHEKIIGTAN
jgi:hypothetical protein